jgi:hypothetical protein
MSSDFLDPDLIAPSSPNSNIEVKKTFEVPENHYNPQGIHPNDQTVSDGPLGAQVPGQLPKVDIDFKIVDDQKTKIVGFQEVESLLLNNKTVSQETAQFIEAKIPGFLTDDKALLRYTKHPSLIGYPKALQYVRKQIAVESDSLYQNLGSMIKEYYLDESTKVEEFISTQLDSFIADIETFQSDMVEIYNKVKSSVNTQFADIDGTFKNLFKDSFSTLKNAAIKSGDSTSESEYRVMIETVKSTISIIEKNAIEQLLYVLKNSPNNVEVYFEDRLTFNTELLEINYYDLLDCVLSTKFASTVKSIFEGYKNYTNKQQSVVNKILDLSNQDSVSMTIWYLENEKNTKSMMMSVHKLQALTALIPALMISIKAVCETLLSVE